MIQENKKIEDFPNLHDKTNSRQILADSISRTAVVETSITPYPRGDEIRFTKLQYEVFYVEHDQGVNLTIEFDPLFTKGILHVALTPITFGILQDLETLFSAPETRKFLQVEESEMESVISDKALKLTKDFILHLPLVVSHSLHQGLRETIINHIKKFVDYDLRENDTESRRASKNSSLLPDDSLDNINKMFPSSYYGLCKHIESKDQELSAYRKGVFSGRKVWLTQDAFDELPDKYQELRKAYSQCLREFKQERQAFDRLNRNASTEKWKEHWKAFSNSEFPMLFLTEDVEFESPSRLAFRQLGTLFDFSAEYMEKLVRNSRDQTKRKSKDGTSESG
jgi:hypothetical protein